MRLSKSLTLVALIAISCGAYADNHSLCQLSGGTFTNNTYNGSVECKKGSVDSLNVNGTLTLNSTTVNKTLVVNGGLDANNAIISDAQVQGAVMLNHTTLKGTLVLNGNEMTIADSRVQNIIINSDSGTSKVYLEGKTVINGTITATGPVSIYISKNAKIVGKVTGAKVIKLTRTKLNK